jgi:hypothetical protein
MRIRRAIASPADRPDTRLRLSPLNSGKTSVPGTQLSLNPAVKTPCGTNSCFSSSWTPIGSNDARVWRKRLAANVSEVMAKTASQRPGLDAGATFSQQQDVIGEKRPPGGGEMNRLRRFAAARRPDDQNARSALRIDEGGAVQFKQRATAEGG